MSSTTLADVLRGRAPAPVDRTRRVDPGPAAAFTALLDAPPLRPGDPLPPLWHWFALVDHPPHAALGPDGHPATGAFLPPIPHRRRMIAGGRFRQERPIPSGAELTAHSTLADVAVKTGRTGELAFVTVRHELRVAGAPVAVEEQDVVYRSLPDGAPGRPPSPGPPVPSRASGTRRWTPTRCGCSGSAP